MELRARCIAGRSKGVTLIELLVVMAIIAGLIAMAVPMYSHWRDNLEFRQAARNVASMLREAKNRAISMNREHRVEFEPADRRYIMKQGNRANNSSQWDAVSQEWTVLPAGVNMSANIPALHFDPNGTSNLGTVCILDSSLAVRYRVKVARTGRIYIPW
jgi:prepilin-type N-terminal cleavage/methylation domain-containing protein